jgi:hypothetical protein
VRTNRGLLRHSMTDIVESGRRFGTELELDSLEPLLTAHGLHLPGP